MRRLTIIDTASQSTRFNVGAAVIVLTFNYNTVVDSWFVDLDINDVRQVTGRRVVLTTNIFPEIRSFILFVRNTSDNDEPIDYDALVSGNAFAYVIEPGDL